MNFDWSGYEGAYGNGASVPATLEAARTFAPDELENTLDQLVVMGLDGDHLTEAAAPLISLLLEEALLFSGTERARPYLLQIVRLLSAGQWQPGLQEPGEYFVPVESEAERIVRVGERRLRHVHLQNEVAFHADRIRVSAGTVPVPEGTRWLAIMQLAGLLSTWAVELLKQMYARADSDGERASLLLLCAAPLGREVDPALVELLTCAREQSAYLQAAAWSTEQISPALASSSSSPELSQLEDWLSQTDCIRDDYVWCQGMLGGVICQAIYLSTLARSQKLYLLKVALLKRLKGETETYVPPAGLASSATWFILKLGFQQHYLRRSPLDAGEVNSEQREILSVLAETMGNWMPLGLHYPSQFGILEFRLEIDHLTSPGAALAALMPFPWPGEAHRCSAFSWLLRSLYFARQSNERNVAFSFVSRHLLADLDASHTAAILDATRALPGFPCRELALSMHASAVDPLRNAGVRPATTAAAIRDDLTPILGVALAEAIVISFEQRMGSRPSA